MPAAGEGDAIVRANTLRHSVSLEQAFEGRLGFLEGGARHAFAGEEIPTGMVHNRQGVTPNTVPVRY